MQRYPRPGEPILPRLLRPLVIDRRPAAFLDADSALLARSALGPEAWTLLPPETCRRLSQLVVDRVQTRVAALPDVVLTSPLPEPRLALALPLERRTINTIRRALGDRSSVGPWTVERYRGLDRFGGRALVDLVAAVEGRAGWVEPVAEAKVTTGGEGKWSARALDEAIALLTGHLPISEQQASSELIRSGLAVGPVDVREIARAAVALGRRAPFQVIELGDSRVIVKLSDLTTARTAYRIAVRAVQGWGTATIRAVAAQLRVVVQAVVATSFVERVLQGISSFRWLDQKEGWFWFTQRCNPLVDNLKKVFSVATRLPVTRVWNALFRTRSGPPPSVEAIEQICAEVPEAQLTGSDVFVERQFDRAAHLGETEDRVARLLEAKPAGMSGREVRGAARAAGLPWTPVLRMLRFSPVVEGPSDGLYRLVGSTAHAGSDAGSADGSDELVKPVLRSLHQRGLPEEAPNRRPGQAGRPHRAANLGVRHPFRDGLQQAGDPALGVAEVRGAGERAIDRHNVVSDPRARQRRADLLDGLDGRWRTAPGAKKRAP